jgi:biopolymer transport protein ExbB/TolQ
MDFSLLQSMSFAGFLTLAVLLLCSLVMVALGFELQKRSQNQQLQGEWLLAQLRFLLFEEKVEASVVRDYLSQLDRPIAKICRELLCLKKPTLDSGDYLLSGLVDRERLQLERGLTHLGTIAVIAPFVGLFGTVVGITKTFADVAKMGKAGIEVVSAGVAEALVATAVGLVVAIISVVLFNYFKTRFDNTVSEWDVTARALLCLLTGDESDQSTLFGEINSETVSVNSAQAFLKAHQPESDEEAEEG